MLSGYCLTLMNIFGMDKYVILEMISSAKRIQKDVVWWLKDKFELQEIADKIRQFKHRLPKYFLSWEEFGRLGLYSILLKEQKYDILAKYMPKVLLKLIARRTNHMFAAAKALLDYDFDKYAPYMFERKLYGTILTADGGWQYLVENAQAEFVLKNLGNIFASNLPKADVIRYCDKRGLIIPFLKKYNKAWDIIWPHATEALKNKMLKLK